MGALLCDLGQFSSLLGASWASALRLWVRTNPRKEWVGGHLRSSPCLCWVPQILEFPAPAGLGWFTMVYDVLFCLQSESAKALN